MMGPSDESTTRVPLCPRCGYDLRGETAQWNDACPVEGRCTECGLDFAWRHVLGRAHALPLWLVESPMRPFGPRVLMATSLRTLVPWRFWRDVHMWHRLNWKRIAGFIAVLAVISYALVSATAGFTVYQSIRVIQSPPHSHGQLPRQPLETTLAVTYAMALPMADSFPTFLERRHQALNAYNFTPRQALWFMRPVAFFGLWSIAGLVLTTASFAALPITRRRAKVRWAHIVRVCAYGSTISVLVLLAATVAAVVIVSGFIPLIRFAGAPLDMEVPPIIILAALPAQMLWWWAAIRYYLKMPHAPAVAIILVLLGWFAFFVGFVVTLMYVQ